MGGPSVNAENGNPTYGLASDFDPNLQNGGDHSDSVALFYNSAATIGRHSCPVDAVLYDTPNISIPGDYIVDETCYPVVEDVGDAPAGSSIRRTGVSTWIIDAPQPGVCPTW